MLLVTCELLCYIRRSYVEYYFIIVLLYICFTDYPLHLFILFVDNRTVNVIYRIQCYSSSDRSSYRIKYNSSSVPLTGLPKGYSVIVALTGLTTGYSDSNRTP